MELRKENTLVYKLAPSILAADFNILGSQLQALEKAGAHYLHIDVMDGCFVNNISIGIPVIKSIRPTSNMVFDVHLMIVNPEKYIEAFANAGADIINVHLEACENVTSAITKIRSYKKSAAITIKPQTEAESVFEYLPLVDMVLIMSVEPGFGGQSFIPETLKKAEEITGFIAKNNLKTEIEMDGGISLSNVREVIDAGVNVVVAGSSVFQTEDIAKTVTDFYQVFHEYEETKKNKESRLVP